MAGEYETEAGDGAGETLTERLRSLRYHPHTGLVVNLSPASVWLGVFFLLPLLVMLVYSFGERGAFGEVLITPEYLGFQQYATFFIPEGMGVWGATVVTLGWSSENCVVLTA